MGLFDVQLSNCWDKLSHCVPVWDWDAVGSPPLPRRPRCDRLHAPSPRRARGRVWTGVFDARFLASDVLKCRDSDTLHQSHPMRVGAPLTMSSTTDRSLPSTPYHDVHDAQSSPAGTLQTLRTLRSRAIFGPMDLLCKYILTYGSPVSRVPPACYSNQTGHAGCQKQQTLQGTTRAQHIVSNPPCPGGNFSRWAPFGIGREGSPASGFVGGSDAVCRGSGRLPPRTQATPGRWVENGWRAATNVPLLTTPSRAATPQAGRDAHSPGSFRPGVGGFG